MSAATLRACTGVAFFGALTLGVAAAPRSSIAFPSRVVHLSGDEVAPGWYAADTLREAVCTARDGGCGEEPYVTTSPVHDGDHVVVNGAWLVVNPHSAAPTAPGHSLDITPSVGAAAAMGRPISLNLATQAELEMLPGIGPSLARRIMAGRPYARFEDVDRVKGIGPAKLARLRGRVAP